MESHYRFPCSSLKCVCVCVCVCVRERERGLKRDLCGNVQETLGQEVEGSESRDTH